MKHIRTIFYIVCTLLIIVACGGGRTPKSVASEFYHAIEQGEYERALSYTTAANQECDTELIYAIMDKERKSIESKSGVRDIQILSEEFSPIEEEGATISVQITYGNGTTNDEVFNMVKVDNRWKIDVELDAK